MLRPATGEVMDTSEIGPLERFLIVIDIAESPLIFAAVTVTREMTTSLFGAEAATAGTTNARESPQQAAIDNSRASDFLTVEYYQS